MKISHPPFASLPKPWDRILPHVATLLVWSVLFGVVYLLRSFFLLLFLTFVFSYIQASGVKRLQRYVGNRPLRVVLVEIMVLVVLTASIVFLIPKFKTQTELFISEFTSYLNRVDKELIAVSKKYPMINKLIPEILREETYNIESREPELGEGKETVKNSPTRTIIQQLLKVGQESGGIENVNNLLSTVGNIGGKVAAVTSAFLLSLLFSFLIVLDLPKLAESVRELRHTKLRFIYMSVVDDIHEFSQVLGRALEAQLIIATINSVLTAIGITVLGIGEHVAFLSVIVFFCSFIPVIGVIISSVPICLIALQATGVQTMLLAILLITIIHLIEGYILNPRVYGSYMRINPVIVLIILTIGGKLFDFWGLLLGVPVCTYLFGHAIRYTKNDS